MCGGRAMTAVATPAGFHLMLAHTPHANARSQSQPRPATVCDRRCTPWRAQHVESPHGSRRRCSLRRDARRGFVPRVAARDARPPGMARKQT